jgi:hypothetical protein
MLAPEGGGGAEGFAGAALGITAMEQNYVNLKGAVDSGQVSITPDAATNAAKACRDQAAAFAEMQDRANRLAFHARSLKLGDCAEGHAMVTTLTNKANDSSGNSGSSAAALFGQAAEIMNNMAATYEAAGKMYHETDQNNARALKGKG